MIPMPKTRWNSYRNMRYLLILFLIFPIKEIPLINQKAIFLLDFVYL